MLNLLNNDLETPATAQHVNDEPYTNSLIPSFEIDQVGSAGPVPIGTAKGGGFWRRQFTSDITRGQKRFDWAFSVILPVICFCLDPIVFRSIFRELGPPILGKIAIFANVLSFTTVMGTMAWLLWGEKLRGLNVLLSGLFAISSVAALVIGVLLFPYSVLGLAFGLIGALGFTPFFTSLTLLRNSIRTFRSAGRSLDRRLLVNSFALAALASAVIPYLINLLYFGH